MKKSTKLAMAFGAMMMFGSAAFAQKTCDLALTVIGTPMTVNYHDTCHVSVKITNNGTAALTTTDTLYYGPIGSSSIFVLIPTANIPSGGSQTFANELYLRHNFDTLTADRVFDLCFKLYPQSTITSGGSPVAVTYNDPVAANDSTCISVTFKKPTVGIFEFGGDKEQLTVFPNPATDNVMFNLNLTKAENVQVAVKDVAGREVMRKDFGRIQAGNTAPLSLDISRLQAGMYFIEMSGEERRAVGRFTKK